MHDQPREPSRLPVRGTIAAVGTAGALGLLLSFRGGPLAPGEPASAAGLGDAPADGRSLTAETVAGAAEATVGPVTRAGDRITTRWGDVQVEATTAGTDITDVVALVLPDGDRRSARISELVEPFLREEAITRDTADVSVISGATYTSEAYAASLQSALDQRDASVGAGAGTAVEAASPEDPASPEDAASPDPAPADPAAGDGAVGALTATGESVRIRWGTVQVAVTAEGDDVIDVEAIAMPHSDRHTREIADYVEPILREEAITSDSADVSVISGATYTSRAYARSLQSALDQLGIA